MFCKRCNIQMKSVMRFENGKSYSLHRCPKCYYETKKQPLIFNSKTNSEQPKQTKEGKPKKK